MKILIERNGKFIDLDIGGVTVRCVDFDDALKEIAEFWYDTQGENNGDIHS